MLESVHVRLEIIKTLLTQAPFLQSAPANATIEEVAEPLVDWVLAGSPPPADAAPGRSISEAASKTINMLSEMRCSATAAARSLRKLEEEGFGFGGLDDGALSLEDRCRRVEQQAEEFLRRSWAMAEDRYRQAMRLVEEARGVALAEIGPEGRPDVPECGSASIQTIPEHADFHEIAPGEPGPPTSRA